MYSKICVLVITSLFLLSCNAINQKAELLDKLEKIEGFSYFRKHAEQCKIYIINKSKYIDFFLNDKYLARIDTNAYAELFADLNANINIKFQSDRIIAGKTWELNGKCNDGKYINYKFDNKFQHITFEEIKNEKKYRKNVFEKFLPLKLPQPKFTSELYLTDEMILASKGNVRSLYNSWISPFKLGKTYVKNKGEVERRSAAYAVRDGFTRFCKSIGGEITIPVSSRQKTYKCLSKEDIIFEFYTINLADNQLGIYYKTPPGTPSNNVNTVNKKDVEYCTKLGYLTLKISEDVNQKNLRIKDSKEFKSIEKIGRFDPQIKESVVYFVGTAGKHMKPLTLGSYYTYACLMGYKNNFFVIDILTPGIAEKCDDNLGEPACINNIIDQEAKKLGFKWNLTPELFPH